MVNCFQNLLQIEIVFSITNFDTKIIHKRKRPLIGYLRQKVAVHLVHANKPASVWRVEQAKLLVKIGDKIPPTIPHKHVLRKAKQQEVDKYLGLENLLNMKSRSVQYMR